MRHGILTILLVALGINAAYGWGIWGHNHINKGAVLALPAEMGMFFYNHTDFITEESTIPDLRKHTLHDKAEVPRHYINLEKYNYRSREMMPKTVEALTDKFGSDSVSKFGILPWYIQEIVAKLTEAFRKGNKTEILFLAADLGHYIGDAHMPLHTSANSDGQLTGQSNVHAFWEAQLPEYFGRNYNLYTGEARYIKNVERATWDIIDSSYNLVNVMLKAENKMRLDNPEDKQYELDANGKRTLNRFKQPIHTYEYAHVYHELLNGMVEKQMRSAINLTASLWYTAWTDAGKPDLSSFDPDYITTRNTVFYKEDMKAWKKGKVKGCKSDKEYPDRGKK